MTGTGPITENSDTQKAERVSGLEKVLGYTFKDKNLAAQALTHSSIVRDRRSSNERLEFLGDRVLGLVVAEMLYDYFPNEEEGALGYRFTALARAESLARVAGQLGFSDFLLVAEGEMLSGKRRKLSLLANTCEAVIAALHLDGGFAEASNFIQKHWQPMLEEDLTPPKDAKTLLQEWVQGRGSPIPVYTVIERTGPDHAPEFTVEVQIEKSEPASAKGASKRAAETAAAGVLYERLTGKKAND